MADTLKEMDRVELVNLERLAYILKGLSAEEFETLEILLDGDPSGSIRRVYGGSRYRGALPDPYVFHSNMRRNLKSKGSPSFHA